MLHGIVTNNTGLICACAQVETSKKNVFALSLMQKKIIYIYEDKLLLSLICHHTSRAGVV